MKILKSFDTKIDAEELLEATEKYGEWNAILVKKHWVKLLLPLVLVFVSMLLLNSMLYVIYIHLFHDHKVLFRILAIFYVYTCVTWSLYAILWIMTNIIWQIKAKKKYIDDISIAEFKQKSFEKFLKRTFVTFAFHVLVFLFNAIVPFVINENSTRGIAIAVWALILDLVFIVILNRVIYRIIEYEMNFDICTKDGVISYKQDWFFKTKTMNISRDAIRVIQHSKEWIKSALFQYGNINIYTDSEIGNKWSKNLELSYIPEPKRLAKKLNAMLEKSWEKANNVEVWYECW
jgi:hypothetical protein